jgi:hypothetical protein
VVALFGDGAANEGIFHEAFNLAALWTLPIVYIWENNQFGLSTAMAESTAIDRLSKHAGGYGIPGETIDGNDVLAMHAATAAAVARARRGDGPSFIEALTWRWGDHSMRANLPRYRTEAAEAADDNVHDRQGEGSVGSIPDQQDFIRLSRCFWPSHINHDDFGTPAPSRDDVAGRVRLTRAPKVDHP